MPKQKRFKKKKVFGWLFDAIQIAWDIIPLRAAIVTLVLAGTAGGLIGYNIGASTIPIVDGCPVCEDCEECEDCPENPECEDCEDCEECDLCPDCPDCPECPKALDKYTCSEISDARTDCHCIPTGS